MVDRFLSLGEIKPQKDDFKVRGVHMDERAFLASDAKEADDVEHFKRFKILDCRLESPEGSVDFETHINVRSNTVKFLVKGGNLRASDIFNWLAPALRRFSHPAGREAFRASPLESIYTSPDGRQQLCSTFDGYWLANVLHDIRELKRYRLEPI